jgi:hypothetical protein
MGSNRSPGQVLINVAVDRSLVDLLDASLRRCRYRSRSDFIRDAIAEKLRLNDIPVPDQIILPPLRTGKRSEAITPHRGETTSSAGIVDTPAVNEAALSILRLAVKAGQTPPAQKSSSDDLPRRASLKKAHHQG